MLRRSPKTHQQTQPKTQHSQFNLKNNRRMPTPPKLNRRPHSSHNPPLPNSKLHSKRHNNLPSLNSKRSNLSRKSHSLQHNQHLTLNHSKTHNTLLQTNSFNCNNL